MMFYCQELIFKQHVAKLTFKQHIENLCQRSTYKLHALRRIRRSFTIEKAKILGNVFIDSQFNYASLIWMLRSKTLYSKLGKIHHDSLTHWSNILGNFFRLLI